MKKVSVSQVHSKNEGMKRTGSMFASFLLSISIAAAQNVGIGTNEPVNKLHVTGSLLVHAPAISAAAPAPSQLFTMTNGGTNNIPASDSVCRIYDPGGPAGNYIASLTANSSIASNINSFAIELTVESIGLGTGDSLIIKEINDPSSPVLLAVGNNYSTTGKHTFSATRLYVTFKSNADASTGTGFSLLFKRLFDNSSTTPAGTGLLSKSLFFDTKNGALRAGKNSNDAMGNFSAAIGNNNTANGASSIAMGNGNEASGFASVALGASTNATGNAAVAIGTVATAEGESATAFGVATTASGDYSTAMGSQTIASGSYATALGDRTTARGMAAVTIGSQTTASGFYSFASGNNTSATGNASTAMGNGTTASGSSSFAVGLNSTAFGPNSIAIGTNAYAGTFFDIAIGYGAEAWGDQSFSIGNETTANGVSAIVIGNSSTASGGAAVAVGTNVTASGRRSVAIGNYVSTNTEEGALAIGDNSTTTVMNATTPNSFRARFAGGYRFFTSAAATTSESCLLAAGSNAWSTTSDIRLKENFLEINGEDFLQKIAAMKLTSWNYKQQDATKFRHYGPMAQDFYAAFGNDGIGTIGNDTTINQADFDGVNLVAIQALEKRTETLKTENERLQLLIQKMQEEIDALKKRK